MLDFSRNVTRSELADALGVSRVWIWRLERDGRLPAGTRVSGNRTEFTPADQMMIADVLGVSAQAVH